MNDLIPNISATPDYDEEDDIKYLLSCIPNNPVQEYTVWLAIVFILKNQDWDDVQYWIDWTNKGYNCDMSKEVKEKWRSIAKVKEGGLTFRSLLMLASYYVNNSLEARVMKHLKRNDEIDPTLLDLQGIKRDIYNEPYVKPFYLETL